jgi:hypothetical protein
MKKINLKVAIIAVTAVLGMSACGSVKQQVASTNRSGGSSPFGAASVAPCTVYDDEENFAATGFASGAAGRKGSLQQVALKNAQDMVAMKMQHAFEGEVKTFFESVGSNAGTDVDDQTIGDISNILIGVSNNTSHSCLMWSNVDDRGNVECYIGIKISKSKVADIVADNLSKSKKAEIRQRAEDFRKQVKEDLKSYKEE